MPPLSSRSLSRRRAPDGVPARASPAGAELAVNASGGGPPLPPITREIELPVPVDRAWAALTDPQVIARWLTCQDVAFDARPGGSYRLFDGDATGVVTRVQPRTLLEYTWIMAGWPPGATPSLVRWELSPASGGKRTRLRLTHSALPDQPTRDAHDAGWDPSFLDKLLAWLSLR